MVFYVFLSLFFIAACCMLTKDATVGPRTMQRHNIALRNRLVTSRNWAEFFMGKRDQQKRRNSLSTSHRITVVHDINRGKRRGHFEWKELRYHLTVFFQYIFFELLFMPGLSLALVVLNCQPQREDPLNPRSARVYVFRPSSLAPSGNATLSAQELSGQEECWTGGHGVDSMVGVGMAVLIYTCAIYHKRQKMRKASTVVFNLIFELFYSMIKALLTVLAVCYPDAQNADFLLWAGLASFVLLEVVNHVVQPCKGYGTIINSYRASTFAIGTVTAILAILVNKYFKSQETKNVSAAIWIAMLFPVSGFAYEYNMLSASLLKGDVPEDKTIADLLQVQERDGDESGIVGGLNVQRIAGSCVARLFHIDPRARDVAVLSQIMLNQSTKSRLSHSNLHHGLSGVFGFFSPSEVTKNVALTSSTVEREDGNYLLSQELDSRSGVRRKITKAQGKVLALHVLQNQNLDAISVNASRLLYPIPVLAIKEGRMKHLDWVDASEGESEILKALLEYVQKEFTAKALPKTITFGKTSVRITRFISDYDLRNKANLLETASGQVEPDSVTVDVKSLIDSFDFDSSGDFSNAFALNLSQHFLTSSDMIVILHLLGQNRVLHSLDLSENCLDARTLPLIAQLFDHNECRLKELSLSGNPLSQELRMDWMTGKETVEDNWDNLFSLGQKIAKSSSLRMIKVEKSEQIDLEEAAKVTRMKLGGSEFDFEARIGDFTTVVLSALIPRFPNLYELDLSKNDVTDKGLHYLATRALFSDFADEKWASEGWQCRVAILNLSENKIRDEGLVSLATMLKRNEFLTKLDLSRNRFSSTGIQFLSKGLVKSKFNNLQELYLEDNDHLGAGALDSIFEVLCRRNAGGGDCSTLKVLSLSGTKIYSAGAAKIGQVLRLNQTLETLNLSNCALTKEPPNAKSTSIRKKIRNDSGLIEVCKSMAYNSGLRVLDLSSNAMVTQEFVAIVIYLKTNPRTTLEHLKVHDNQIGISMAQFRPLIIEEVLTNAALQRIDLYSNPTGVGVTKELAVLMQRKKAQPSFVNFG